VSPSPSLRTETDPLSEKLCFVVFRIPDDGVQKPSNSEIYCSKKGKVIPVPGLGSLYGSEISRIPHFLNNQLTDGGEVVSLKRRPRFAS
jgi:hypothetical protein